MLLSTVYPLLIHSFNKYLFSTPTGESHVSYTSSVQPRAEISMCTWQDTHWSCSSERPHWQDPLVPVLRFMLLGHWSPRQLQEEDFWEKRQLNGGHSPGWCPNTLCSVGLSQLRPESRRKYTGLQRFGQQEEMLLLGVVCGCKQENPKLAAYVHSGGNEPKGDDYNWELL